jgi:catechol 2,3-dioxygenase-like lactoylglutathione lyase family enzyme
MGGTLAVAALGALLTNRLAAELPHHLGRAAGRVDTDQLIQGSAHVAPSLRAGIEAALDAALDPVFLTLVPLAALGIALATVLEERPLRAAAPIGDTASMAPTDGRASAGLHRTIPALPVRDVRAAVAHYRERFGFDAPHETDGFAVLTRDDAVIHLWVSGDEGWRERADLAQRPIHSGAESFLAGTGSCRVEVVDVDALYDELRRADVLHPVSRDGVATTDFGTREFATVDLEGNLLTFFRWES